MGLQKLFSVYYLASAGYRLDDVNINDLNYDVLWHDFISMPMISTESLTFYSDGIEASRIEKIKFLSKYEVVQNNIHVCVLPYAHNCGKCEKCIRTMAELYMLDKLELFDKAFPIKEFKKHYVGNIAKILSNRKKPFNKEIIHYAKINSKKIPLISYPLSYVYEIENSLKKDFTIIRGLERYTMVFIWMKKNMVCPQER